MRVYVLCILLCVAHDVVAMPLLKTVQSLSFVSGKVIEVRVTGERFSEGLKLWTSFIAKSELINVEPKKAVFRLTFPAHISVKVGQVRVYDPTGISAPFLVLMDPLSAVSPKSTQQGNPQPLAWPVAIDGKFPAQSSHWFALEVEEAERLSIEVYSERLSAKGDPVIRLFDPEGREVGYADDDDVRGSDAALMYKAPMAGIYLLELRDVQYRGGERYHMRVGRFDLWPEWKLVANVIREHEPNDEVVQATFFTLGRSLYGHIEKPGSIDHFQFSGKKDQWIRLQAHSRRIGSPAYIVMDLRDAAGKILQAVGDDIAKPVVLRHRLPANGSYTLCVEEYIRQGGPRYRYRIDTFSGLGELSFAFKPAVDAKKKPLPLPDRLWAIPGQQLAFNLQVVRRNYEGRAEFSVNNDWVLNGSMLKEKAKEHAFKLTVPSHSKPGELHFLTFGFVADGVRMAPADFSEAFRKSWGHMMFLPGLDELPVSIIEPVHISMNAVQLKRGGKVKVRIDVHRAPEPLGQMPDPQSITLALKNLPQGVSVPDKLIVDAKKDFIEFEIKAAAEIKAAKVMMVIHAKGKYRGTDWERKSMPVNLEVAP